MQKFFKQIVVSAIILQAFFGFILPAQAQTEVDPFGGFDEAAATQQARLEQGQRQADDNDNGSAAATRAASLQQAGKETNKNNTPQLCTFGWDVAVVLSECAGIILLSVGSTFVGISGAFLNFAIDITVLQMSKIVNDVGVITAGWKTFRDLANMFFIFILLKKQVNE